MWTSPVKIINWCCFSFHINHIIQYISIVSFLIIVQFNFLIAIKNILVDIHVIIVRRNDIKDNWRKIIFNCTQIFIINSQMTVDTTVGTLRLQLIGLEIIRANFLVIDTISTMTITITTTMPIMIGAIGAIGFVVYSRNIANICIIQFRYLTWVRITMTQKNPTVLQLICVTIWSSEDTSVLLVPDL